MPEQTVSSRHLRALRALPRHSLILAGLWGGHAAAQDVIQEVIVTAQKTAQPASKTPLALSVLGGDDLRQAGATNPVALTELAPNVQITTDTGMLQVAIRGVVSLDTTEKGDSSTAFNVDGAYVGRTEAQLGSFLDLERIEVLRGPQGTLYGRNATAGAINLITNKPTRKLEGRVDVEIGDYATRRVEGAINIPVNDVLALRAAAAKIRHDTYLRPGPNTIGLDDRDDTAGRVHALLIFTPQTSWLLTAERAKNGGNGASTVPLTNFFTGTPLLGGNNLANPVYVDRGANTQLTAAARYADVGSHRNNVATTLRSEFKTRLGDAADLTYQFARLHADVDQLNNGTYFGFPMYNRINGESTQRSHEIRLNSSGPTALSWVAGVYRFDEDIYRASSYNTVTPGPVITLLFTPTVVNESRAAFGQLTYRLDDRLRLTAGARTTRDDKSGHDPLSGSTTGPGYTAHVHSAKSNFRLAVDYDLAPAVMAYGSLSTGYKAGGFNDTSGSPYKPENLTSVEAGIKGRFLANRLRMSAAVFHYDYKDMQLTSVVCSGTATGSDCGVLTTNASNATVKGVEAEATFNATPDDKFNLSLGTADGKFKRYRPNVNDDWSGSQIDRAPTYNTSLSYAHTFGLENGATVQVRVGTRLNGAYFISDPSAGVRYRQPAYRKSDVAVTYTAPAQNYYAQAYVRNIENSITLDSLVPGGFGVGAPRTYGVRAGTQF
ncbi:TonB-dependent receptor [Telluria mixta]|uniref:TonB-dependent receptor n=1 Tax=Telluria mixta TaxID=34071 RepID=A0ABT2C544_9BURK|nr:TonB-dependent receptor [Telluria mixta]MCS0632510.1 TonB-dependent receptor [Telluria mixta]WEM99194.1 TonB-dependent receptor [Telluria mixta]